MDYFRVSMEQSAACSAKGPPISSGTSEEFARVSTCAADLARILHVSTLAAAREPQRAGESLFLQNAGEFAAAAAVVSRALAIGARNVVRRELRWLLEHATLTAYADLTVSAAATFEHRLQIYKRLMQRPRVPATIREMDFRMLRSLGDSFEVRVVALNAWAAGEPTALVGQVSHDLVIRAQGADAIGATELDDMASVCTGARDCFEVVAVLAFHVLGPLATCDVMLSVSSGMAPQLFRDSAYIREIDRFFDSRVDRVQFPSWQQRAS